MNKRTFRVREEDESAADDCGELGGLMMAASCLCLSPKYKAETVTVEYEPTYTAIEMPNGADEVPHG